MVFHDFSYISIIYTVFKHDFCDEEFEDYTKNNCVRSSHVCPCTFWHHFPSRIARIHRCATALAPICGFDTFKYIVYIIYAINTYIIRT